MKKLRTLEFPMRKPSVVPGVVGTESTLGGSYRWLEAKNTLLPYKRVRAGGHNIIVQVPILILPMTE